jgi:hypothetical protein
MMQVRQRFDDTVIDDIDGEIDRQFAGAAFSGIIKPGMRVGITVGSRGIANLRQMVTRICYNVKKLNARPVTLPSMGSHGGGDAQGQVKVLKAFGISEETTGAPVLAGMEVENLGICDMGLPVYYDKLALGLDGVILFNRIKAHTDLNGEIESGLHKMTAIGLGNHIGAQLLHAEGIPKTDSRVISVARYALQHANILFGIGVIENAYDHTANIVFVERNNIASEEPKLLLESRKLLPRFFVNDIDVLAVDCIGKDISGDGMDPNVIGRGMVGPKNKDIHIQYIIAMDLSEETGSNAVGIGLADITTRRLYDKIEFEAMYTNAITAKVLNGVRIPIVMENDMMALKLALMQNGREDASARVARIKDTVHLGQIMLSQAFFDEIKDDPRFEILGEPAALNFDRNGNFYPFEQAAPCL